MNQATETAAPAVKPAVKKAKPAKVTKKAPAKAKAVKKAKPATDRLVPADLSKYTKDSEHKTSGGNVSVHCGDKVAKALIGKDLEQVYAFAAKTLKEPVADLKKAYKHLNPGMQRMNLGNRIRAAL